MDIYRGVELLGAGVRQDAGCVDVFVGLGD